MKWSVWAQWHSVKYMVPYQQSLKLFAFFHVCSQENALEVFPTNERIQNTQILGEYN